MKNILLKHNKLLILTAIIFYTNIIIAQPVIKEGDFEPPLGNPLCPHEDSFNKLSESGLLNIAIKLFLKRKVFSLLKYGVIVGKKKNFAIMKKI